MARSKVQAESSKPSVIEHIEPDDLRHTLEHFPDNSNDAMPALPSTQCYVALGRAQHKGLVPLALTIHNAAPTIVTAGLMVSWSDWALKILRGIRESAILHEPQRGFSLPYTSLRTYLEIELPSVIRMKPSVGLHKKSLFFDPKCSKPRPATPFMYLDARMPISEVASRLTSAAQAWLVENFTKDYIEPNRVDSKLSDEFEKLVNNQQLFQVKKFEALALPWNVSGVTGTTEAPAANDSYRALVDWAAVCLAGNEILPDTGPLRRIVAASIPDGEAHLLTRPLTIPNKPVFSFLITLRVATWPFYSQPLLVVEVGKRRYLKDVKESYTRNKTITGYVFSEQHSDRVFGFKAIKKRTDDGKWQWQTDASFTAIKRSLGISLSVTEVHDIIAGKADAGNSQVKLTYHVDVSPTVHEIQAGVPEIDKLEAFERIQAVLGKYGVQACNSLEEVRTRHNESNTELRMINAETMLAAAIDVLDGRTSLPADIGLTALRELSRTEIDDILRRELSLSFEELDEGDKLLDLEKDQRTSVKGGTSILQDLLASNRNLISKFYPKEKPVLLIFHEEAGANRDLRLLETLVTILLDNSMQVRTMRLPPGTHGPKDTLPGNAENKAAARLPLRVEAWRQAAEAIAKTGTKTFCLVMARMYYAQPKEGFKRDDIVNKAACKQALSTISKANVQYLLPPRLEDGKLLLTDFVHRLQSALKDLIFAHSGMVAGVSQSSERCFSNKNGAVPPREVIGVTIVRKNGGRAQSLREESYLCVAFRITVSTGLVDVRCAYEGSNGLVATTRWEPFADGLAVIAKITPVRLATQLDEAKNRFMDFCSDVITSSVNDGNCPVVLIDSTNCSQLWGWLADVKINPANIAIGKGKWMQDNWKGARIIRVRHGFAPDLITDAVRSFALSSTEDTISAKDKVADKILRVPTNVKRMYKVSNSRADGYGVYFSVASPPHQRKRGQSCYRQMLFDGIPKQKIDDKLVPTATAKNAAGEKLICLESRPAFTGQWPCPNPVEFTIVLKQDQDNSDHIAEFVESLRFGLGHYGGWVSLPAPLFFERVVREYISRFTIEESDEGEEEETDDD